jgi:starvation-inducible DNA-binding protein
MHQTKNTLSENVRIRAIALLNKQLAAAIDLHAQIKQAHWNVRGHNFIALHELFDDISEEAEEWSDLIAERAAQLGGDAEGTVQTAAAQSYLKPYPLKVASGPAHVEALSNALAAFGEGVRKAIDEAGGFGDADTADIFTEVSRGTDKFLWFVESHREPTPSHHHKD